MTQTTPAFPIMPNSIEELKAFVNQFVILLPEEKRNTILAAIEELETSGGIQNEAQAQMILAKLMKGLGL